MILVPLSLIILLFAETLCLAFLGRHFLQVISQTIFGIEDVERKEEEKKSRRGRLYLILPLCQATSFILCQIAPISTLVALHQYYDRIYLDLQLISAPIILVFWMAAIFFVLMKDRQDAESTFSEQEKELLEMDINDRWKVLREQPELQGVVDRALRKKEALKKDQTLKVRAQKQSLHNPAASNLLIFGVFLGLFQLGFVVVPENHKHPETILCLFAFFIHTSLIGWIGGKKILFESAKLTCFNLRLFLQTVISTIRTGGETQDALKKLVAVYEMLSISDPFVEELSEQLADRHKTFDKVLSSISQGAETDIKKFCELTALMHRQGASLRSALEDLKLSPSVVTSSSRFYEGSALQSHADPGELLVFLEALRAELLRGNDLTTSFSTAMAFVPDSEVLATGLEALSQLLTQPGQATIAVAQLKVSAKRNRAMAAFAFIVVYSQYYPQTFPLQLEDLIEQLKILSRR